MMHRMIAASVIRYWDSDMIPMPTASANADTFILPNVMSVSVKPLIDVDLLLVLELNHVTSRQLTYPVCDFPKLGSLHHTVKQLFLVVAIRLEYLELGPPFG